MINITNNPDFAEIECLLESNLKDYKHTVLIVDDEINNLQLLKRTFHGKYIILSATNGLEALHILEDNKSSVSVIISDHKMPEMSGTEFLEQANQIAPDTIKILLTGYSDIEILTDAVNKCNLFQYIMKPYDPEEVVQAVSNGIEKYELTSSKSKMLNDLRELFYETIKSIANALDSKDQYTHGHSIRVTLYSLILAKELGLDEKELEEIETAGLLHDIGKIAIPRSILCKPGRLTDEEFNIMRTHPENSAKLVSGISKLKGIVSWVQSHHERYDGFGYPKGLKGEEIPLPSRIIAIADTYDAMTSSRSYRSALTHEDAIKEIERCKGSQFDPVLAEKFIELKDVIKEAKEHSVEYYEKYSYLKKIINFTISNAK